MPKSELHSRKLKKNIVVFGLVIGFIAVIWTVTMVKIANNKSQTETTLSEPAAAVE